MPTVEERAPATASVVVPAHNEERVIGRTLHALHEGLGRHRLEVVVVCNGCSDDTASVARSFRGVRVLEIPDASKARAVAVGNGATDVFPRVHLDADVELDGGDLLTLIAPLATGDVLATAPARVLPRSRAGWVVRAYYDVWERLPQVRAGLFGRGVVALSREGQARVSGLPRLMSDDLGMSEVFDDDERLVVEEARVVVQPPVTARDLLRRRIRVCTGNAQAGSLAVRRAGSRTSPAALTALAVTAPRLAPRIAVFVVVTVLGRLGARSAVRRRDFTTWLRDESSRA